MRTHPRLNDRWRAGARTCAAALLLVPWPAIATAQIPEKFTNLQVLPRDIPRTELVQLMTGIARDLGVRCASCHVGGDANSLQGMDFASDSTDMKRKARVMLGMVNAINGEYLSQLGAEPDRIRVQCITCHRGVRRPEQLSRILVRTARAESAEAAVAEYRRLREAYFGSGSYDFGENTFIAAALELNAPPNRARALTLLNAGLEWHSRSANVYGAIGVVNTAMGDTTAAIAAYERALEIQPGHQGFTQLLARLRGR